MKRIILIVLMSALLFGCVHTGSLIDSTEKGWLVKTALEVDHE